LSATVLRQFIERQFIEIEPTVYRTTVYRTTVYRTYSLANRQFIEPKIYRKYLSDLTVTRHQVQSLFLSFISIRHTIRPVLAGTVPA